MPKPTITANGYVVTGMGAGEEISSTYEGRHVSLLESSLTHPSHTDGLVDKGDPVVSGNIVGVAFTSATAATDLIAIDTEGIWVLTVSGTDDDGNSAVAVGDELFINTTTCAISKARNKATQQHFGYALGVVGSGSSAVCAVKVHWDPDDAIEVVGDSTTQYVTDTAGVIFREYRYDSGATSGDARGQYIRLYLTGAGGGGEALRAFTTVKDVAGATAHGAHISLNFNDTGSITGQGIAGRNTLHVPDGALSAGTYAPLQAEIYADGSSADISGATEYSLIRCLLDGDATGIGNADDNAYLISLIGGSVGAGKIMAAQTLAAVSHTLRIKGPDGGTYYLMVSDTQ